MAVAFGIFAPADGGDLPASYGTALHKLEYVNINGCSYQAPLPGIVQSDALKLGTVPGDADPVQTADDNASGADEDAVTVPPDYDGSGVYSISVSVSNTTGSSASLTGWFDHNKDGAFGNGESVTVTIPDNATNATLTWTGLPPLLPRGTVAGLAFRFRISSSQAAVQSASGLAPDGEVEDHFVACRPVQVITINDQSICSGQSVQLTAAARRLTAGGRQQGYRTPLLQAR